MILLLLSMPSNAQAQLDAAAKAEIDKATKAIEVAPTAINYAERGRFYCRNKMYGLAIGDYNHAIKLMPNQPGLYWRRAEQLYQLKKYNEAIDDCSRTLRLSKRGDDDYQSALAGRARCYDELGKEQEAIADLRELTSLGDSLAAKDLEKLEKKWAARQRK